MKVTPEHAVRKSFEKGPWQNNGMSFMSIFPYKGGICTVSRLFLVFLNLIFNVFARLVNFVLLQILWSSDHFLDQKFWSNLSLYCLLSLYKAWPSPLLRGVGMASTLTPCLPVPPLSSRESCLLLPFVPSPCTHPCIILIKSQLIQPQIKVKVCFLFVKLTMSTNLCGGKWKYKL